MNSGGMKKFTVALAFVQRPMAHKKIQERTFDESA